jgi:glyoxylase-like metal-dependent hydrolase (beta-lactamase superfamily II)
VIFSEAGEVRDGFSVIGYAHYPIYLLKSEKPILVEGGLSLLGEAYRMDLSERLGRTQPELIFLTHVHFDHCGAVPYLKKFFPGLRVAASSESAEILKRPNAIKLMREFSEDARDSIQGIDEALLLTDAFEPFEVDMKLREGDKIAITGGLSVEVLSTPGHTRDSLSYYIPEKKILVASEAAGCAVSSDYISVECLKDFGAYLSSLKRLASLDVEILCQGHRYVYTDNDVQDFFERSLRSAHDFKEMVEKVLHRERYDMKRVVAEIKKLEYEPLPQPKQSEQAYLVNLEARIRSILNLLSVERELPHR